MYIRLHIKIDIIRMETRSTMLSNRGQTTHGRRCRTLLACEGVVGPRTLLYHMCFLLKIDVHVVLFLCRSSRPSDFSYKHDAKHSNMLIVAHMWDEHNDELYLHKLSRLLNTVKTCMIPL